MPGFVIEYNRRTGAANITEFAGADGHRAALRRRLELEVDRHDDDIEIVSLASDSLETVRTTHSRYFARDMAPA